MRPFTLGQLKELLSRTGTLVDDGFWIDKIKSHCYVTVSFHHSASGRYRVLFILKVFFSLPAFSTQAQRRPSPHGQLFME